MLCGVSMRRAQLVAHGHRLDAADEGRAQARHRAGELDVVQAFDELAEDDAQLEAGEVGAEAEVLADAEAEVRVGRAVDAEGERLVEDLLVAIRRRVEQAEFSPAGMCWPRSSTSWIGVRQNWITGDVQRTISSTALSIKRRVTAQLLQLGGVLHQRHDAAARGVAGGLVAGDDQQEAVREELEGRHVLAVDLARWPAR